MMKITRANVELLLDAGLLQAAMGNGRWWGIRRNGRTQFWKRAPHRFRVPIKAGLRSCADLNEANFGDSRLFRVRPSHDGYVRDTYLQIMQRIEAEQAARAFAGVES
jgi:hypothetical protein